MIKMVKKQKQEEFECDCCGRVLTPSQMKIEKKINTDLSPCFCNIIIELDKKNKLIKKLKKIKEIKTETKPINIKFKTNDGKNVSFKAVKVVEKKYKK
jgi:hypothetical protein